MKPLRGLKSELKILHSDQQEAYDSLRNDPLNPDLQKKVSLINFKINNILQQIDSKHRNLPEIIDHKTGDYRLN